MMAILIADCGSSDNRLGGKIMSIKTEIAATKLNIPNIPQGMVTRARLLKKLDLGMNAKLTLVCAQAGSGKSTLVGEWVNHTGLSVAWVSLDAFDDDFSRFWRCVIAAIDRHISGFSDKIRPVLNGVQPSFFHPFIARFLNELSDCGNRLVIVLDDYHALQNPSIHASVSYFLKRMPEHIRLLIVSRTEPPLPLTQLAANNDLLRLGAEDLNFTIAEGKEFCRLMKLNMPAVDVERLLQRTEGWVTGMKLAALSLQGGGDVRRLIQTLTGDHRYLADYLFHEVFCLQSEPLQSFLKRTAILNRLCAPLCDVVSEHAESRLMLEKLEHANLFLIPLDQTRDWYRYHYLFADFLQRRLRQENPELWRGLHYRAAKWYESQTYTVEAIEHYLAGNYHLQAVRLIDEVLPEMIGGRWETLYRWLSAIPETILEERPELYFTLVFFMTIKEDWAAVRPKIAGAEKYIESRRLLWTREEANRYAGYLHLIKSYAAVDHLQDLNAAVVHSREYFHLIPDTALLHDVDIDTGDISILRAFTDIKGRLGKAEMFFRDMLDVWRNAMSPFTGMFYVGLAEVMYERNRLEEAEKAAWKGYEIGKSCNSAKVIAPAAVLLSKIYAVTYSVDRAAAFLQKTIDLLRNNRFHFWADIVEAQRLRLRLKRMTSDELQAWWEQWSWLLEEDMPAAHLFQAIVLTRVLIALERWDEADYWLATLRRSAEREGRLGERIELLLLHGLLYKRRKQIKRALAFVSEALVLAEPEHYVRTFLDEAGAMAELLRMSWHEKKDGTLWGTIDTASLAYLRCLDDAFKNDLVAATHSSETAGIASLTDKEQEVLFLLAEGLPNRQIAMRMHISIGTVKTHLHRVYEKLQVKGRWEAIEHVKRLWINR
jgi:LuxR family maltose regulon positive regulatory protein